MGQKQDNHTLVLWPWVDSQTSWAPFLISISDGEVTAVVSHRRCLGSHKSTGFVSIQELG